MPSDRERQRAKRRQARRQAAAQARQTRTRRTQQIVGGGLAVLLVGAGVVALNRVLGDDDPANAANAAGATSSAAPCQPAPAAGDGAEEQKLSCPDATLAAGARWDATVATSAGPVTIDLLGDRAPMTVSSFLQLSRAKYFDATTCHRLTTGELKVLQCGDPTGTGRGGPGYQFGIENAPPDGRYPAGTVAMARTEDPSSNGSQFFVVYGDSELPTSGGGYSVFGKVTQGLEVLQAIAAKGTTGGGQDGPPKDKVTITHITVEKQ